MTKTRQLLQEIELVNRRYELFKKNDRLLVALSGGPDSVALLMLLEKIKRKYSLHLSAAHLHHGLQERQGSYHAAFAGRLAKRLKIPFWTEKISLRQVAKKMGRSLEEAGRISRYTFLENVATKARANKIVTAHTLDDQAETLLMRIARGTGLRGLSGIAFKRNQGGFLLIRPLLLSQKYDLVAFLREIHQSYCTDKTNKNYDFTRNRIRHKLLPWISRYLNPQVKMALSGLQEVGSQAQDYIERRARNVLKSCIRRSTGNRVVLVTERLRCLHPAILNEVLCAVLAEREGGWKGFGYSHISDIISILKSEESELELHLPGKIRVKKTRNTLEIFRLEAPALTEV